MGNYLLDHGALPAGDPMVAAARLAISMLFNYSLIVEPDVNQKRNCMGPWLAVCKISGNGPLRRL